MEIRGRMDEEFELEDEGQAFKEYTYITSVIAVNYSLIADELSNFGDFSAGLAIDLGTGLGDLAIEVGKRYPKLQVAGIDISEKAIEEANKKAKAENLGNINFRLADVHNLPFENNSVDLVVSHGAIHHLKDVSQAFLEIYRVLKPNAVAYITDLRRDAPQEVVKQVENNLPTSQAKGFINSIRASYIPEEFKKILTDLGINQFEVSGQRFSRNTIFKNKDKLRSVTTRSADYTKLSQTILIRKE